MKIGFDVSQTGSTKAGCGYFADSMIAALAEIDPDNEYILYPTFGDTFWNPDWRSETRRGSGHSNMHRGAGQRSLEELRSFWSNPPSDWEARLGNPDIIHANNFFCPPHSKRAKVIYTLYDLGFLENPEWTTEENRVACFTGVFNAGIHADRIIAISDFSRRHFLEHFPHYPEDQISVIYPASRFHKVAEGTRPTGCNVRPGEFWLHVGTIEPRKNLTFLLDVLAELKNHGGSTAPLVLAGGHGWLMDDFKSEIESRGLHSDIIQLGYITDREIAWLYENCIALVFPSHFEGFGMPVLEAMSLGSVPIAFDSSSIPEITGRAGILVAPNDRDAFVAAMVDLRSKPILRNQAREECRDRAAHFSWRTAAAKLLRIYQHTTKGLRPQDRNNSHST